MEHLDLQISVGKRYISAKINENSIEYWQWNSGYIRAIELADNSAVSSPPKLDYNTVSINILPFKLIIQLSYIFYTH